MKKLGKLSINPEKVIKNDELVNLRGGYDPQCPEGETFYKCWLIYKPSIFWYGCYTSYYDERVLETGNSLAFPDTVTLSEIFCQIWT
jgi:hypothetical protein